MEAIIFVLFVAFIIGYVLNIVKLSRSKQLAGIDLLRVVGIFILPMGAVLGFC